MRRSSWLCACGAALLAVLATGCHLAPLGNPLAGQPEAAGAGGGRSSGAARAGQRAGKADRSRDVANASRRGTTRPRDQGEEPAESLAGASSSALQPGDPVTMAVIEQELRDFPPDERLLVAAELKKLSPDNARMVLKTYRMMNRYRQEPPDAAGSRAAGARSGIEQTGYETPGQAPRPRRAGLPPGTALPNDPLRPGPGERELPFERPARDSRAAYDESFFTPAARPGDAGPAASQAPAGGERPADAAAAPRAGAALAANAPRHDLPAAAPAPAPDVAAAGAAMGGGTQPGDPLTDLIAQTEAEAARLVPGETDAERQKYIEKQVHLRMLYLQSGQQERALAAIPGVDPADQEFWQQTFWALANYFDDTSMPRSSDRATQTVAQLGNALSRLARKAHLELRNVNFCHKIGGFGNYEKYPRDEFAPGQEVYLYAELANTASEPAPEGLYRTSHKSTLEIYRYGATGELLERIELPETTDLCRVQRRDYFHSYYFTIPSKLSAGPHLLKLSVEDLVNHRVATCTINFLVK